MVDKNSLAILELAKRPETGGIHLFAQWFFGVTLLPKQFAFHHAETTNVTLLGGIGCGKTMAVALSLFCHAATIPYFRGLNTSITSSQAELPFVFLEQRIEENDRLKQLVTDIIKRPYPTIKLFNGSELSFRTAGYEARNLRGFEYDRINYDEGGYEFREMTLKALRGRLRGRRPDGTPRMARLDVTTTPTDSPWLIQRWQYGDPSSDQYRQGYTSIRMSTYENIYLTREQIEGIISDYTDELIRVEIMAQFPDYGTGEFPSSIIDRCTDYSLNDLMESHRELSGYVYIEHPRHGCLHWEEPPSPHRQYAVVGDPGTDGPPRRNSAVVMVWDVSEKPYRLIYFHWIDGNGSYIPFLQSYQYAVRRYSPQFTLMDTSGPQKALDELALKHAGIHVEQVPFGKEKDAMINRLKMLLTNGELRFPFIRGIIRQLRGYTRKDDKIPQDIVSAMLQLAHLSSRLESTEGTGSIHVTRYGSRSSRGRRVTRR